MVARPLMKKVPGNSSTAARSNRRLWLWFAMVFVMALASFLNFFESFKSFQFATSSSSAQSSGDIESIETQGLQMYPFGIQHYQKAIHHLVQDEYDDEKGSKDECLYARDYGLLQRLRNSSRSFCTDSSSPYTFYHVARARLSATMLENFVLDVRGAEIAKDIESLADDGSGHDPRFTYMKNSTFCRCTEPQDHAHGAPNIWKDFFVGGPGGNDPNCKTDIGEKSIDDKLTLQRAVVLMFQNRVVHFESALLVPYEVTGPLMSHLDDNQPCYDNDMIKDFRDLSLKSLGVTPRSAKTDPKRCLVTVISRRPYGGRRVQRLWRNEDEILRRMREEYQDAYRYGECEFQSLEFTNMTMHDQMKAMLDSDVVIGMHGAGMVNVLWTRPETLVIEIFPRRRFRWGYRNICQYIGCKWHDFRRGRDIGIHSSDPNDMDKFIPYPEWKSFFDSLFRYVVDNLEQKVGEL
ncbi:hypothetical protein JG687_00006075 [Phytophthora cactorum]|uniref:Glycosyltransferase 61 catalytic domain-containing protein n=1 Tax=Phytophthora cactorum TaxID=29920 RepID=A0A8T1UNZ6_9STRA|nr:hypothetical protein JG687_00006075 [Phytophthora cactorum]